MGSFGISKSVTGDQAKKAIEDVVNAALNNAQNDGERELIRTGANLAADVVGPKLDADHLIELNISGLDDGVTRSFSCSMSAKRIRGDAAQLRGLGPPWTMPTPAKRPASNPADSESAGLGKK